MKHKLSFVVLALVCVTVLISAALRKDVIQFSRESALLNYHYDTVHNYIYVIKESKSHLKKVDIIPCKLSESNVASIDVKEGEVFAVSILTDSNYGSGYTWSIVTEEFNKQSELQLVISEIIQPKRRGLMLGIAKLSTTRRENFTFLPLKKGTSNVVMKCTNPLKPDIIIHVNIS